MNEQKRYTISEEEITLLYNYLSRDENVQLASKVKQGMQLFKILERLDALVRQQTQTITPPTTRPSQRRPDPVEDTEQSEEEYPPEQEEEEYKPEPPKRPTPRPPIPPPRPPMKKRPEPVKEDDDDFGESPKSKPAEDDWP